MSFVAGLGVQKEVAWAFWYPRDARNTALLLLRSLPETTFFSDVSLDCSFHRFTKVYV